MHNKFSERLRELRFESRLTQEQLAFKLGVSRTQISDWERRGIEPTFDVVIKIAKYFSVSTDFLFGLSDY